MARVFLDANYFIDAITRQPEKQILESLENHTAYISPLALHIYCYLYKIKIPDFGVFAQREKFEVEEFSQDILDKSLNGPTADFEDNVQLHSAASAQCDLFLTNDKKLQNLRYFGKTKIVREMPHD